MLRSRNSLNPWPRRPLSIAALLLPATAFSVMGNATDTAIAHAITAAVDALRRAVLQARQGAPTSQTADAFADGIEAAAEALRSAATLAEPLETRVAGSYYALGDPPSLRLRLGDRLTLRRDRENRHDRDAVGLHATCGTRVGYLPRGHASDLARHLDAGLPASAVVSSARGTDIDIAVSGPAVTASRLPVLAPGSRR